MPRKALVARVRAMLVQQLCRVLTPAANWVDLQWSVTVEQLRAVAPRARGRLLDVGCGSKPYEAIFRPYVSEYVGLELESSFAQTSAASSGRWCGPARRHRW